MKVSFALVAVVAAAGAVAPSASATPLHLVSPLTIERDLAAGGWVADEGVRVGGDVDLTTRGGKIEGPFVCNRCRIDGRIIAPHVLFERGIDLSGSEIEGALNLHGAVFREPALFGQTVFGGGADFAFAAFRDLAVFRAATFDVDPDFTSTQFRSVARFGDTTFDCARAPDCRTGSFEDAIFAAEALFAGATFTGGAQFDGALFGSVSDFRRASFLGDGSFREASFRDRADFSRAIYRNVVFEDTRFGSDALFLDTNFGLPGGGNTPAVGFLYTTVDGRIDLQRAHLSGPAQFLAVSADSLLLDGMSYDKPSSKLAMTGVVANDVSLEMADVGHLAIPEQADEQAILHTAEETANSAGKLGLANDLHYRLQEIARGDDGWPRRIADNALYRGVGGYFVRPFRPLLWLLGIVLVAASLRALRWKSREPGRLRRAWRQFVRALLNTITRRGQVADEPRPLRSLELVAYAALLGCFLLGLANANPTLRDMVDAIM
jgi:uncharacterized protein YjbI with pentapeptide repeats